MSNAKKPPRRRVQRERPSKAALRRESFNSVRLTPMRARQGPASAAAPEQIMPPAAQAQPVASGPDYLAGMQAYRAQLSSKALQRTLVSNAWTPIGPSAVRKGQAGNRPVISGRVSSIAIAPDSTRIYVGAANGGVWRSEDGGESWTPLMEAFDLNPQNRGADSLAVGALALVPGASADEDTLYVGSGEAIDGGADPTSGPMFGVGPIVSTDGGQNWQTELTGPGGPWTRLVGGGFFELAVDPNEPSRVLGATLTGLFRREPAPLSTGFFRWQHITLPNIPPSTPVTSVVAALDDAGATVFYAACKGGPCFRSADGGVSWSEAGTDFPGNVERVRLAVDPGNARIVYALTTPLSISFTLHRLDLNDGRWRSVGRLLSAQAANFNGQWNLALAVTPGNPDRVYIGGGATRTDDAGILNGPGDTNYGATLFRVDVTYTVNANGSIGNPSGDFHYIGGAVHPDVHAIVFPPDNSNQLWVGCDGGVFYSDNAPGTDEPAAPRLFFEAKNTGLQTLMMHHLDQHPEEEAVLFGGTQDNGCLRFTGEEAWLHAQSGDCGFVVINWQNPYRIIAGLQFDSNARRPLLARSHYGGNLASFRLLADPPSDLDTRTLFYYPLAGTPPGTSAPNRVVFGSLQPWVTENFGRDWQSVPSGDPALDELVGPIRAIAFSTPDCFFVGTHSDAVGFPEMGIYRFDRVGGSFQPTRLDRRAISPSIVVFDLLPFEGSVSDIAIDWSDPTGRSIYVAFGGYGSFGHVWHHDGLWWRRRDGGNPGQPGSLLDVPHNAIVVDPENPATIYAAADIGIWRSTNGGQSWQPFAEGLPDAAVVDLKLHPRRVLRAATHGRGVFERRVDVTSVHDMELFIRDTQLDLGKRITVDGLDNPLQRYTQVWHWKGPDIKLDFPDFHGDFQFAHGQAIDFAEFVDELRDDGLAVGHSMESGDEHVVYAQIHNRGERPVDNVQVTALITPATTGLPPLPWDYEERVQQGQAISSSNWETIGITTLDRVEARVPGIVKFVIPSDKLPPPTDTQGSFGYSVLMLVHHPEDPYPITPWQQAGNFQVRPIPPVDVICRTRRLAAVKSVTQQPIMIAATFQEMDSEDTIPFTLFGPADGREFPRLRFRLNKYPGRVRLFVPKLRLGKSWQKQLKGWKPHDETEDFVAWAKRYVTWLEKQQGGKRANHRGWTKARIAACEQVAASQLVLEGASRHELVFDGFELEEKESYPFFLRLDHPKEMLAEAQRYEIEILYERRTEEGTFEIAGGQTVQIVVAADEKKKK